MKACLFNPLKFRFSLKPAQFLFNPVGIGSQSYVNVYEAKDSCGNPLVEL